MSQFLAFELPLRFRFQVFGFRREADQQPVRPFCGPARPEYPAWDPVPEKAGRQFS